MLLQNLLAICLLLCELSLAKPSSTHPRRRTKKRRACVKKNQSFLAESKDGIEPVSVNQPIGNWTRPVLPSTPQASNLPSTSGLPSVAGCIPDGTVVKASFTIYGTGDAFGSSNCKTNSGACSVKGPGLTVAISENAFDSPGPGKEGTMCGATWRVEAGGASHIVTVDNLCPAQGNPLCAMPNLQTENQAGGNVHFDLCIDSGAGSAVLGSAGLGHGTATKLSGCSAGLPETS